MSEEELLAIIKKTMSEWAKEEWYENGGERTFPEYFNSHRDSLINSLKDMEHVPVNQISA